MQEHMGLQLGRRCTDGRDFADTSRTSVSVSVTDYPSTSDSINNQSFHQPTHGTDPLPATYMHSSRHQPRQNAAYPSHTIQIFSSNNDVTEPESPTYILTAPSPTDSST
jgi:hypothetical protein